MREFSQLGRARRRKTDRFIDAGHQCLDMPPPARWVTKLRMRDVGFKPGKVAAQEFVQLMSIDRMTGLVQVEHVDQASAPAALVTA